MSRGDLTPDELGSVLADVRDRSECSPHSDLDVYSWPQTWSYTTLGFNRPGGQTITSAQTTVVIVNHSRAYVYFGGIPAYEVGAQYMREWMYKRPFQAPSVREAWGIDPDATINT